MAKNPFVTIAALTAISQMYRNKKLIADMVLPRAPVFTEKFAYTIFNLEDSFAQPNTRVGRTGKVDTIDWGATQTTSQVFDEGLDDVVPIADIKAAEDMAAATGVDVIDPLGRSVELLTQQIANVREVRAANLVFNPNSYVAAQKVVLAGASQWSDAASDPVTAILTALDIPLVRPNIGVIGQAVWTKLRLHPKITAAINYAGGNASVGPTPVARAAVAELFELDELLVGEGYINTAKKGQTPVVNRVWGKHASFMYRAPVITGTEGEPTFGLTAEYGARVAGSLGIDYDVGLRGAERIRVGESVRELITASPVGFYFENAVA
jgi:hypothetical protein